VVAGLEPELVTFMKPDSLYYQLYQHSSDKIYIVLQTFKKVY